jgi:hypothetical protein
VREEKIPLNITWEVDDHNIGILGVDKKIDIRMAAAIRGKVKDSTRSDCVHLTK